MKLKAIFLIFFLSVNSLYSQAIFPHLELEYSHSIVMDASFSVVFYPSSDFQEKVTMTYKKDGEIVREQDISRKKFDEIYNAALRIRAKDLSRNFKLILDGATTRLIIGDGLNYITYSVEGLTSSAKNNSHRQLFKTVRLILGTAGIKVPELE